MLSSWSMFCLVGEVSCWASALLRLLIFLCSGGLSHHHSNIKTTQKVSPLSHIWFANRDLKCSYKTVIPHSWNHFLWNTSLCSFTDVICPSTSCPQHMPNYAPRSHHFLSWVLTPSMYVSISTLNLLMTRHLWVCPVMTSYMSQTQGTMGSTTGVVRWWIHAQPSTYKREPCLTITGTITDPELAAMLH